MEWLEVTGWVWVEVVSLCVAISYVVAKYNYRNDRRLLSRETARDLCAGISIFPLLLMASAPLALVPLETLLEENRVLMTLAAAIGLFAILERAFMAPVERRSKQTMPNPTKAS